MLFEGVPVNDKVNDKLTHIRISKISETFYSMLLAFQLSEALVYTMKMCLHL